MDDTGVLEEIAAMDLVYYRYKNQEDDRRYLGLIAEEAPEQVVTSDTMGYRCRSPRPSHWLA